MFSKILLLVLIAVGFLLQTESIHHCITLNHLFTQNNSAFVQCVLDHNEKATFCADCEAHFRLSMISFNDLVNGIDNDNTTCRSRFIDINQLNLVETIHENTKHLWDIGYCSGIKAINKKYIFVK